MIAYVCISFSEPNPTVTSHLYLSSHVVLLASAGGLDFRAVDAYFAFNEPEPLHSVSSLVKRSVKLESTPELSA